MPKDNKNEEGDQILVLVPNRHPENRWVNRREWYNYTTYVLKERLMLASPIAAFPRHWVANVNATNNIRSFEVAYLVECVERLAVDLANTKSICVFKAKKKRIYSPRHIKGHSTEPKSADKKKQVRWGLTCQWEQRVKRNDSESRRSGGKLIIWCAAWPAWLLTHHWPAKFFLARDELPVKVEGSKPFPTTQTSERSRHTKPGDATNM